MAVVLLSMLLLQGSASAAEGAPEEYKRIMSDLQSLSRSAPFEEILVIAGQRLGGLIERYPGSKEAANAEVTLGKLYCQAGRYQKSVVHLERFLTMDVQRVAAEENVARFLIARCYIEMESFDEAERFLRLIVEADREVKPQLRARAAQKLAQLGTLRKLTIGSPALDFSLQSVEGKRIMLERYRGKVVLLDFWATWCQPCRQEMPIVRKIYNEFHDAGFEVIGISLDDNREKLDFYLGSRNLPWPQIFDGKGWNCELGQMYAIGSIPATFLLDKNGRIRHKNIRGEKLRAAVRTLLGE